VTCTDFGPNPFVANYRITSLDETEVFGTGEVHKGDEIDISNSECLPDSLMVKISVPTGALTQEFTIDSSCDVAEGFIFNEDYGSFEANAYFCGNFGK
jgi:hypothetical protein